MQNIRAAAVQMISSTNPDANIDTMKRLVRQAAEQGADWVLLPEYWPLMGRKDTDKLAFAETLINGRFDETRYARFSETRCARFQTTFRSFFVGILGFKPLKDTASRQNRPMPRLRAGQSGSAVW